MKIIPAIDIINGSCVRLFKGDYATAHKVADSPAEMAVRFEDAGAKFLHIVDLDGAKSGRRVNGNLIIEIAKSVNMSVQVGGGIRDLESIDYYAQNGIDRIILGSLAIKNRSLLKEAVKIYSSKIVVGIDAKNGFICVEGWQENAGVDYITFAKNIESIGVETIIFTDIDQDGMLSGPNLKQLKSLSESVSCKIIASGGVSSLEDIKSLSELNIFGVICGKSIYTGNLDLKQAVEKFGSSKND